ncbi:hypothetical protein [Thalassotalea ganghwensis]
MRFPRPIYENLPYFYFIVSGLLLVRGDGWGFVLSAALFYGAGCITLVTRSAARRKDRRIEGKRYPLPEILYEYLPYGYGALAIFIVIVTENPYFQFASMVICVIALRNLIFRHNNRVKRNRKL